MKNLVITQIAGYFAMTITIVIVGVPVVLVIEEVTGRNLVFVQRFLVMFVGVLLGMIVKTQTLRLLGRTKVRRTSREKSQRERTVERFTESHWFQLFAIMASGAVAGTAIALLD